MTPCSSPDPQHEIVNVSRVFGQKYSPCEFSGTYIVILILPERLNITLTQFYFKITKQYTIVRLRSIFKDDSEASRGMSDRAPSCAAVTGQMDLGRRLD